MDLDAKLFYRKLLDFGPGVGMREGQRKYEEEMRKEEERIRMMNADIGMSEADKYLGAIQLAAAYSPLIPDSLQEKYKKEANIDKYFKNMERLKKRGIV